MKGSEVMTYFNEMQMKIYPDYSFCYYRNNIDIFTIHYRGEKCRYCIEDDMSLFGCGERKVMGVEETERFKEFKRAVLK